MNGKQKNEKKELNLCNQYCFVPGNGAITFDCVYYTGPNSKIEWHETAILCAFYAKLRRKQ